MLLWAKSLSTLELVAWSVFFLECRQTVMEDDALCGLWGVMRPWFDFWFWRYIYSLLGYIVCFPTSFFLHFFLTYRLPYLSFPLRIDPLRFQGGCHKRRLNLALVFSCLFCVVVYLFWLVNVCFCCVGFSFFSIPRDWFGETSPKWRILCQVGCKTTTQSITEETKL